MVVRPHEHIQTEVHGPVGILTVDRPQSRNAMTRAMWEAMPGALGSLASQDSVRVVAIRGAGGNFVAGADITEFTALRADPELARRYDEGSTATLRALAELAVPSIAVIEGACVGGGCLIAFGCDLRLAAQSARLAIPAGRLGLAYPHDGIERLVAVAGEAVALDLLLTARFVGGEEALRLGLVHRAVTEDTLESALEEMTGAIASSAPLSLRFSRLAVRAVAAGGLPRAERDRLVAACFGSEDYQEGIRAFLEKRRPAFRGR